MVSILEFMKMKIDYNDNNNISGKVLVNEIHVPNELIKQFKAWRRKSQEFIIIITPRSTPKFPKAPFIRPLYNPKKQQKRKLRLGFLDPNKFHVPNKKRKCYK